MKIIKFSAENIKKLKAVHITPSGSTIEVTGPNGSGKTSVLDAIYFALRGQGVIPTKVVREGEEQARVKLDLGDDQVELSVTRKFKADGGTSLVVEAPSGARFPSPQSMLDALVGQLSFDPLAFIRMKPAEQLEQLRQLVKFEVDLNALDAQNAADADERRAINRQVKQLEARVAGLKLTDFTGVPDEHIHIEDLTEQLEAVGKHNADLEKRKAKLAGEKRTIEDIFILAKNHRSITDDYRQKAAQLLADAEKRERQATEREDEAVKLSEALDVSAEREEPQDTIELRAKIKQAQETNRLVERKRDWIDLEVELTAEQDKADVLTKKIEAREAQKKLAIESAVMPVESLSFGAGEVIYRGFPLANASHAEQIRVSVAIAMALNPKLRVLRVSDGSLLDEKSLAQLAELCKGADYQLWIERVEQTGSRPTIVMEDGEAIIQELPGVFD